MIVKFSTSGLKQAKWYEFLIRFALGGLVTAGAGLVAKKFGPSFGGLFLAFPAILVASTTLIERHEQQRKRQKGLHGLYRGRDAAGADSAGAAIGSLGLMTFAWWAWELLPEHRLWVTIASATFLWSLVSFAVWWLWKRNFPHRLASLYRSQKNSGAFKRT
jgi:hypothetical protein